MDPILETIVKKYRKPWPDRDFWDFLRGVKVETYNYSQIHTTRDVVFPDHPRVPTKPIEFKAENFRIENPNKGVQPSPAHEWKLSTKACPHITPFRLPPNEVHGWEAYQCGDCGLMVKRSSPVSEIWYSKGPHDLAWATPEREIPKS